jgi:hypothetical protein
LSFFQGITMVKQREVFYLITNEWKNVFLLPKGLFSRKIP